MNVYSEKKGFSPECQSFPGLIHRFMQNSMRHMNSHFKPHKHMDKMQKLNIRKEKLVEKRDNTSDSKKK